MADFRCKFCNNPGNGGVILHAGARTSPMDPHHVWPTDPQFRYLDYDEYAHLECYIDHAVQQAIKKQPINPNDTWKDWL